MFILNVTDTAAAKALMDDMPLSKANLANYEYIALGPFDAVAIAARTTRVEIRPRASIPR